MKENKTEKENKQEKVEKPKKSKEKLNLPYEFDASQLKGEATEVLLPISVAQLIEAVKKYDAITPRGGGTGLAGGCVPTNSIVLDLSKLDKIKEFDEKRKKVIVEAGVILEDLQNFLLPYGLEFPVKPSSYKACTIGGMIATDAVGNRAIKYGRTSRWVDWIEIINADGHLERKGKTELADYSGMEGITGIIVAASLSLSEIRERTAELFSYDSLEEVMEKVKSLKHNENVSMIEFLDKKASGLVGMPKKYTLIIEFESDEGSIKGKEYDKLFLTRDSCGPVLSREGYTIMEDPKIILDKLPEFMKICEECGSPVFGHLGIGILHPRFSQAQAKKIAELLSFVVKTNGKVSGEHGIGATKKQYLDEGTKKIYQTVKHRIDPKNKFNPGKII